MTFGAALEGWHDFYVATAGAAAALLGLLFVGVSINLGALNAVERLDIRERANQAFANLVYVLVLSLTALIPDEDAGQLAITCGILAVVGLLLVANRMRRFVRAPQRGTRRAQAIRRLLWTVSALLVLAYTAYLLATAATSGTLYNLISVIFLLLIGSADVAWDILTTVSNEESTRAGTDPS